MSTSVTIVICTRGRPTDLGKTLESLERVTIPDGMVTNLLLVENGTKMEAERLAAEFRHPRISAGYLFEPQPGKSRALNKALRQSKGEILLFSDDDVRFPLDWVERMTAPIASGQADAVAGGVALAPHLLRPWMTRNHRAWLASTSDYLSAENPSEMCGANMAVRTRALSELGGFDVELGPGITNGGEETLLSWQLKQAGFRLVGALDVQVQHHPDPRRLRYENWVKFATMQGWNRAYQLHHWLHDPVPFPRLQRTYFQMKLGLRRLISKRRRPEDEGIEPWELSYLMDIARCDRYALERRRPRNYAPRGLRKLAGEGGRSS